jgi:hypothetical protein
MPTPYLEELLRRPASTSNLPVVPSLDSPSVDLHPVSQVKPGKWKNKLADLLNKPKPETPSLMDAPSLAPSYSKKAQKIMLLLR